MKEFYKKSIEQSLKETETSFSGLTSKQVEEREKDILKEDFYDEKNGIVNKFFAQFFDLMIIILLLASVISIAIGIMQNTKEEIIDGAVILAIVIMNAIFGVAQEYKAEKSLNALKKLTEQEVFVFRDGTLKKISSNELVIGDIISLEAGIILPADCRIIEGFDLKVDESSLTGESLPVYKVHYFSRGICIIANTAETALGNSHNQCGRYAFTGYIANGKKQFVIAQTITVQIASYLFCRHQFGSQLHILPHGKFGQIKWQHIHLYIFRI